MFSATAMPVGCSQKKTISLSFRKLSTACSLGCLRLSGCLFFRVDPGADGGCAYDRGDPPRPGDYVHGAVRSEDMKKKKLSRTNITFQPISVAVLRSGRATPMANATSGSYYPTNIGIARGTLSAVTLVVVSNGVNVWVALRYSYH